MYVRHCSLTAFRLDSQLLRKLHSHVARRGTADKSRALITFSRGFAGECECGTRRGDNERERWKVQ